MDYNDLEIICNAVAVACRRLAEDGIYMSDERWIDMMRRLRRADRIVQAAAAKRDPCTLDLSDTFTPNRRANKETK